MAGVELFRPQPRLEIPDNQPKVPQLDFTPLSQIGNTIVEGQRRQAITEAIGRATGPNGQLDFERAGAELSKIPGALEEARPFLHLAMQKTALAQSAGHHAATLAEAQQHHRALEGAARDAQENKLDEPIILKRINPETEEPEDFVTTRRQLRGGMSQGAPTVQPIQRAPMPSAPAPAAPPLRQSSFNERFPGANGAPPGMTTAEALNPADETVIPTAAQPVEGQAAPVIPMRSTERPPPIPGASPKTLRQERAKKIVSNEEDAVKSARAAADLKPYVDQAVEAYEKLIEAGGIGPMVSSGVARTGQSLYHGENEALRQRYDTAVAGLKARIVAAQNKGEGSVSNFERQLYGAQFPGLDATDPNSQVGFLRQLRESTNTTIKGGKDAGILANAPNVVLERPAIQNAPPLFNSTTTKIDPAAAKKLLADPSPENRRYFDEIFGIGAATAVTKRRQ